MEFRLLGPVELWVHGRRIDLGPTKTQLLLAVLLFEANRTVPFDTLVRRVWDEAVPIKAAGSVQQSLSRLRRRLETGDDPRVALDHVSAIGYRLLVPPEQVDALEFNRTIALARTAAERDEGDHAITLLRSAEQMINGEPLAGLPGRWAQAARAGLQERQHAATLTRIGLQLDRDDPRTLIGELRELAGRHRFDEAVAALLMCALHAAGRSADALAEYTAISRRLRDELGIDPHRALNDVHRLVLRGEEAPRPPQAAPPTPSPTPPPVPVMPPIPAPSADSPQIPDTLERDPPGFVGRQQDLDLLYEDISTQLQENQSVLCVIDGMPGVGKSALALRLAHLLRKHCPDGALELHLRGHDPHQPPTSPEAALGLLLAMLRVDVQQVQRAEGLDHAISLWRRRTSNRRLLILLDDAAEAEQIRPLIPSGAGSVVLVTTRSRLTDLPDALRHTLQVMRAHDARELFVRSAQLPRTDDPTEDDPAVQAVVSVCGRLPLALSIAGGFLRMSPSWSVADLAEHLTSSLASQESDTIGARLNATFETSYRDLSGLPRQLFRRLALYPGARISLSTATALAGTSGSDTDLALTVLVDRHLLTEPQRHYYKIHDLLRVFAAHALARDEPENEQRAADDRLVRFTLSTIEHATARFHPHRQVNLAADLTSGPTTHALNFHDAQQAAAWLDTEQTSLRSVIEYWHTHGHPIEAAAAAHMLAMYLDRRTLWKESIPLHENALGTFTSHNHQLGQAHALTDLATARYRLHALDQARHYGETALKLWRALDSIGGQADALLQLGRVHYTIVNHAEAIDCYQKSVALRLADHDKHGQAVSMYHLGMALFAAAEYADGIAYTQRALNLARAIRDEAVERNSVNNLGELYRLCGNYPQAEVCYREALALAQQLGDSRNIAVATLNLGDSHACQQHPDLALPLLDSALETFRKLENRYGEANTLLAQVRAYLQLCQEQLALALLCQATAIAEQIGDPLQLANAHLTAGGAHLAGRDLAAALKAYQNALSYGRKANVPLLQAAAHHGIGDTLQATNRLSSARSHWQRALTLYGPVRLRDAEVLRAQLGKPKSE